MTSPDRKQPGRVFSSLLGRVAVVVGVVGWAGCMHYPAGGYAPCSPQPVSCYKTEIAKQVVEDTGTALVCRPLHSALEMTVQPASRLVHAARGAVAKRLVTPLLRHCQHEPECGVVCCRHGASVCEDWLNADTTPAYVEVLPDGPEALAALHQLIDQATCRIDVLMFQWNNDEVGKGLAEQLAAKAGPNLRVRVLVDGGGNLYFGDDDDPDVNATVRELAQKPYVEVVRVRNPFARYDHRKLVLVDGRVAFTGGRNFTNRFFSCFRDLSLKVAGPLACELQRSFDEYWVEQGGEPGRPCLCRAAVRELPAVEPACPPPNAQARMVETAPFEHQIQSALYEAVDRARDHIYLENFSFGDSLLVHKLARACGRGVDVRVITTLSPSCTGVVCASNRMVVNRLLKAGVKVFIYPGMTHAKAGAVDGVWAYVGTGNFDALSFRRNRELGFVFTACPVVQDVEKRFFGADFCPDWELKKPYPVTVHDCLCEMASCIWF